MNKYLKITTLLILTINLSSCESAVEKKQRIELENQRKFEIKEQQEKIANEKALKLEQERIEQERMAEKERKDREILAKKARREKTIYDKYINKSLQTGATPYSYCYGKNKSCSYQGCSSITVKTPFNSDVLVTIKRNGSVVRHAYINSGTTHSFEFPNGTYQAFFYYGKGWNPNKVMKQTDCGTLKGGFVANEDFSKDNPQKIENSILSYELILQENGNLRTKPSNPEEAF